MSRIQEAIQQMSVEEMQKRLAEYMAMDKEWAPKPIAIEVRHRDIKDIKGSNIYDVIVINDDESEVVINFGDRYSKLLYIYCLMHSKGFQRRSLDKPEKGFPELASLYRAIFIIEPERLISAATKDFDHTISMAISFIHKAFKGMVYSEELSIGNTRKYSGKIVIPAVYDGLNVIIDSQLQNQV